MTDTPDHHDPGPADQPEPEEPGADASAVDDATFDQVVADFAAEIAEATPEDLAAQDPRDRTELLAALTEAESKRDEYLDDLRRTHAEFENFRKRSARDAAKTRDEGRADILTSLLEVLDDFDRTMQAVAQSEDEALRKGVGLVHEKLELVLGAHGLTRIDDVEVAFDPEKHEAVQQVPADEPLEEPLVAEVFRSGYSFGARTLRAAMVVVRQ